MKRPKSMKNKFIFRIIICVILSFLLSTLVYARTPYNRRLLPLGDMTYKDYEVNIITNVVNGEVGGIIGNVTIIYPDGEEETADACVLHKIHARVVHNQTNHYLFPDSIKTCVNLYWTPAYASYSYRSSDQWLHCREDVLNSLAFETNVPDNILAATCDPYFADKYDGYKLWAKIKWDTGWVSGTFYYYYWEG